MPNHTAPLRSTRHIAHWTAVSAVVLASLTACGGAENDEAADANQLAVTSEAGTTASTASASVGGTSVKGSPSAFRTPIEVASLTANTELVNGVLLNGATRSSAVLPPTTQLDAVRLANQATFGPTEPLIEEIRAQGAATWITHQMLQSSSFKQTFSGDPTANAALQVTRQVLSGRSAYARGGDSAIHRVTNSNNEFCFGRADADTCWRDYFSTMPLLWDFYRNAIERPDQLRQRVAFALQQIAVVSNFDVNGTYGFREYHNNLLVNAFGNYRDVLRKVTLSPVMGDYLNNANNNDQAPNENYARELLQLFALGTCELNTDGSVKTGDCVPTYNNEMVRNYAFALTGWTYPPGGATSYGCWPEGANCRYYQGDMVPVARYHNTEARQLLAGVSLPAGHTAPVALERVLDSIMNHPNTAPFITKQLIQQLVTSNPSAAYVTRVSNAFISGNYSKDNYRFGRGQKGDLQATVAAVLLDEEARTQNPGANAGRLREPVQLFTGVLRALNGRTDGDALSWWWGEQLRQHMFRSPSVFNYYPPDYPVPGTALVGPAFGIHNANTALQRINYLNALLFWGGPQPESYVPNALGTQVNLNGFAEDARDPDLLVKRLSLLALGEEIPDTATRAAVVDAVASFPVTTLDDRLNRVQQAAYLVFASPQYQIVR